MVWNFFLTHLKENGIQKHLRWWNDSKIQVIQDSRVLVLLSRGTLKKKTGRDTIHFYADVSNTELLLRLIHSQNQLSIYGAVSTWCAQFGLTGGKGTRKTERIRDQRCIDVCEITRSKTFGIPPKLASGNSLRENIQDFESLTETIRFTTVRELAWFRHRVSAGMNCKTTRDNGFGQIIPLCREYTFHRASSRCRVFAAILGGTIGGPVIEVPSCENS